jgi:integrase
LRLYVLPYLDEFKLYQLRALQFDGLYSMLLKRGLSAYTVRNVHIVLRQALEYATRYELIDRNPLYGVKAPPPPHVERRFLLDDQLQALLDVSEGTRWHAPWAIMGTMAIRIGELLALRVKSVDFARRYLTIDATTSYVNGVGLVVGPPKTESSNRRLYIGETAYAALRKHRVLIMNTDGDGAGWHHEDLLFPAKKGGLMRRQVLLDALTRDCKRAGISRMRPHELRHTAATSHLGAGQPLMVVKEMLGHRSIQTTVDIYGHTTPGMHQRAMEEMDTRLRLVGTQDPAELDALHGTDG